MGKTRREVRALLGGLAIGMAAAAIIRELDTPPQERQWHGRVAGIVPYDFRWPTFRRLREAYWNPENPHIITDRVLGVGWTVNLYSLLQCLSHLLRRVVIKEDA